MFIAGCCPVVGALKAGGAGQGSRCLGRCFRHSMRLGPCGPGITRTAPGRCVTQIGFNEPGPYGPGIQTFTYRNVEDIKASMGPGPCGPGILAEKDMSRVARLASMGPGPCGPGISSR